MKMKTGPKVLVLAILFLGVGYWAGRGFPQTWQAFAHPDRAPVAVQADTGEAVTTEDRPSGTITDRRVNDLEDRVTGLEKTVEELRSQELRSQAPRAPEASVPADTQAYEPAAPDNTAAPDNATPPAGTTPFPGNNPPSSL